MKASTIKIENPLLNELHTLKPPLKSLSAFIKGLLEDSVRQKKMKEAAEKYSLFLESNPDEDKWLGEWESSKLTEAPKLTAKGRKK